MKNTENLIAIMVAAAFVGLGCGGGAKEAKSPGEEGHGGGKGGGGEAAPPSQAALERFNGALDAFNGHDKANDWNDQTCADTANMFIAAAAAQPSGKFAE